MHFSTDPACVGDLVLTPDIMVLRNEARLCCVCVCVFLSGNAVCLGRVGLAKRNWVGLELGQETEEEALLWWAKT